VTEVISAVERVTGKRVPRVIGARREGDPPKLVAESKKLRNTLKWKPTRSDLERIVTDAWQFASKRGH
jgi:UDP-glucose 4-epimerase